MASKRLRRPAPNSDEIDYAFGRERFSFFIDRINSAATKQGKVAALIEALRSLKSQRVADDDLLLTYIMAVQAMARFIEACAASDISAWIDGFAAELTDLDNGAGSKLLGQKPGRADRVSIWRPRAYVAVGVDVLLGGGTSLTAIIERLDGSTFDKKFPNLKKLLRRKMIIRQKATKHKEQGEVHDVTLGKSAFSWRKELMGRHCRNNDARAIWDGLRRTVDGLTADEHAIRLFRVANDEVTALGQTGVFVS